MRRWNLRTWRAGSRPSRSPPGSSSAPELKLELLEQTSEHQRLVRLCEILETAAASVERQRAIADLAQTNGHAKPG